MQRRSSKHARAHFCLANSTHCKWVLSAVPRPPLICYAIAFSQEYRRVEYTQYSIELWRESNSSARLVRAARLNGCKWMEDNLLNSVMSFILREIRYFDPKKMKLKLCTFSRFSGNINNWTFQACQAHFNQLTDAQSIVLHCRRERLHLLFTCTWQRSTPRRLLRSSRWGFSQSFLGILLGLLYSCHRSKNMRWWSLQLSNEPERPLMEEVTWLT